MRNKAPNRTFLLLSLVGVASTCTCMAASAPLDLVAMNKGGGEDNGLGDPGASASDGGNMVMLSGDFQNHRTMWTRFIKSNGKAMDQQTHTGDEDADYPSPQLAAMNGLTGEVAGVTYWKWRGCCPPDGAVRIVSPDEDSYESYYLAGVGQPLAISMLNSGDVAMIHEGSTNVVIYKNKNGSLVLRKRVDLSGASPKMKKLKKMVYDAKASALFVGGNVSGGNRGIARVDVDGDNDNRMSTAWVRSLEVKDGTPQLLLRRSGVKSAAAEVLLLSRSFYARVNAWNGKELYLKVQNGDDYMSFLPEGMAAQAAYDPTRDVLYSTADTMLRQHHVKTGEMLSDMEFYYDPPKHWDIKIKDANPSTVLGDYPPRCGAETYPDHPDVPEGKWKNITWRNADDKCSKNTGKSSECPAYKNKPYKSDQSLCDDGDICCIDNDCCVLDGTFWHNWQKGGGPPDSRAVHVTDDGNVHVVIDFSGWVRDEDDYYEIWLATFSGDGNGGGDDDDDDDDDGGDECENQTSKSKCRQAVTPTGCFWKSSSKACKKASKCSMIKKNEEACLGATQYDCAYAMKKADKYVCTDEESKCNVARDKTACNNNGCSWKKSTGTCRG